MYFLLLFLLHSCHSSPNWENHQNPYDTLPEWRKMLLFADTLENCHEAERLAFKDFTQGRYTVIRYGLMEETDTLVPNYFKQKFNINILYGGCVGSKGGRCYTDKMQELLYRKGICVQKEIWTFKNKLPNNNTP